MAYIISADDIKKEIPGYEPEKSESFHRESAKIADKKFEDALREQLAPKVILLAGGAASGKTEYISAYLQEENAIVFDATLRSFDGARSKIHKAQNAKKDIEVAFIIPKDIKQAFDAFLHRDRKFPEEHFYATHSCARKAVLEVAQHFDVPIKIYQSSYETINGLNKIVFDEIDMPKKESLLEFLTGNQYTEDEIKRIITHEV